MNGSVEKCVIDENIIRGNLKNKQRFTFEIFDSIDSTNTYGKKIAAENAADGSVIIAKEQTAGRGRMNRKFHSPSGTGLYMSIVLRPKIPPSEALFMTTAAAVAVAEAVEKLSGVKCGIKWVNDVYSENKKICGILTEASAVDTLNLSYAVVGIGINVSTPNEGFHKEIQNVAGSIFTGAVPKDFSSLLIAEILNGFFEIYDNLPQKDFMLEYGKRSVLTGKEVNVLKCGEICGSGTVEGIDAEGRLILRKEDGSMEFLSSGEISVKQKDTESDEKN